MFFFAHLCTAFSKHDVSSLVLLRLTVVVDHALVFHQCHLLNRHSTKRKIVVNSFTVSKSKISHYFRFFFARTSNWLISTLATAKHFMFVIVGKLFQSSVFFELGPESKQLAAENIIPESAKFSWWTVKELVCCEWSLREDPGFPIFYEPQNSSHR